MSTMYSGIKNNINNKKDNSSDISVFEQSFTQLPTEGKFLFKEFLQNLVSIQETMTDFRKECTEISSN